MGIADFGVGKSGAYEYNTTEFLGTVYVNSLSTRNATGDPSMGFQLNVNLAFTYKGSLYVYWVQDVAQVDTSSNTYYFIDNVWNLTAPKASMSSSGISGNGVVDTFKGVSYYYDVAGGVQTGGIHISIPASVSFLVRTGLDNSKRPTVSFEYAIGPQPYETYDTVTFTKANDVGSLIGFEVNGKGYDPANLFYDAELVMGGAGGGQSTVDVTSDVRLNLAFWNGHNMQAVPNSVNFGGDTAETISNASSTPFYAEETGVLFARVQAGSVLLSVLYGENQIGTFSITGLEGGGSTINGIRSTGVLYMSNATMPNAVPMQIPYIERSAIVTLYPGTYLLKDSSSGTFFSEGNMTVSAGQTMQVNAPLGYEQFTLSYSVIFGSQGLIVPSLTYIHNGISVTSPLTTQMKSYTLDYRSPYSITSNLTAGYTRWITDPSRAGVQPLQSLAWYFMADTITYYHQFQVKFSLGVQGGGSGYSDPSIVISQLGIGHSVLTGRQVWADAGSPFYHPSLLHSSNALERWVSLDPNGTIARPGTVVLTYHNQFGLVFSYDVAGGGSPSFPTLNGISSGKAFSVPLKNLSVYFLDPGTTWSVQSLLPGRDFQERWFASEKTNGTVYGSSSVVLTYIHQYVLTATANPMTGGTANITSFWADAGARVQVTELANAGWQFEGWKGSGNGSYTGSAQFADAVIGSPIVENATFFPGLKVSAGNNGAVYYSFGSHKGVVPGDTTAVIYAPIGTDVILSENISSVFYRFSGWSRGTNGTAQTTSVKLNSPIYVTATFTINTLLIEEIGGTSIAAIAAIILVVWTRRAHRQATCVS